MYEALPIGWISDSAPTEPFETADARRLSDRRFARGLYWNGAGMSGVGAASSREGAWQRGLFAGRARSYGMMPGLGVGAASSREGTWQRNLFAGRARSYGMMSGLGVGAASSREGMWQHGRFAGRARS